MSIYHCANLGAGASGAPPSKFDCDGIMGKNSITNKYCPRLATYFIHLHLDLMKLMSVSSSSVSMNREQNKTSFLVQLAFAVQKTPCATLWASFCLILCLSETISFSLCVKALCHNYADGDLLLSSFPSKFFQTIHFENFRTLLFFALVYD